MEILMSVILRMKPKITPVKWSVFCVDYPPFSVALDGFVIGEPKFKSTIAGPYANFNHHEGVNRLATRSTCAQVLMAIRQGFLDSFSDERGPHIEAYANDCDEDICLAWFMLKHNHFATGSTNPLLNRLVSMEDALDSTAGAYPFSKNLPALRELAWVFEPYRNFRSRGELDRRNSTTYLEVVELVEHRIMQYLTGMGKSIDIDIRYKRIGGGKDWAMIKDIGAQARTGLFSDDIKAYVSARQRPDGNWIYTVGRMSPFIKFPLHKIYKTLNTVEQCTDDCWGGGDIVGGSPRTNGSKLSPQEVEKIINKMVLK